ncbi:hypothetical protein K7957_05755 [Sphingomonas yunnanensis]|uniref:hypothetical protein n=1 Tax=Sphingomonas yunnanensis TaxID=310400 RepID=UPI001CA66298|nr:hypothetical protein [Sphingomonas yunnanensis]MBY9062435.1 hypothetical protein [Sphingomonas yunnanensis]
MTMIVAITELLIATQRLTFASRHGFDELAVIEAGTLIVAAALIVAVGVPTLRAHDGDAR